MKKTKIITFSKHKNGEDLTATTIADWQEAGVKEIWDAMREITVFSYQLRGEHLPLKIDRSKLEMRKVPWLTDPSKTRGKDFDT